MRQIAYSQLKDLSRECIHCPWKNGGNALASSILLVSIIVKKQGPIKIKN